METTYITQVLNNLKFTGTILAFFSLVIIFVSSALASDYEDGGEYKRAERMYKTMRTCLWLLGASVIIIIFTPKLQ